MTLRATAEAWLADDPDPRTRRALSDMLDDEAALASHFGAPLAFGTAGLRGALGPGPARMNRRVVAITTAGLCAYLERAVPDARARGLCIAHDARHGSAEFTHEAIAVALGAGFVVHAFRALTPTPLLAFAVGHRNAAGGVMITASHNPKGDNGYKVYFAGGVQISTPHDDGIATAIATVTSARGLPRANQDEAAQAGVLRWIDAEIETAYRSTVRQLLPRRASDDPLRIAYTPLHGVAGQIALLVLEDAGFHDLQPVTAQFTPDPDFPTLTFPNPEEPGTVDALLAHAERCEADVAVAHDPDGDRLALAARDEHGRFSLLSGNETGLLLTDYALQRLSSRDARPNLVCSTVVSSPMVADIAAAHGARLELTLTGFKWMCSRAIERERQGDHFVFAFEDAMGYALGDRVRDKDGLSAAVLAAQLASECRAAGLTLWERLGQLFARHGHALSAQHALTMTGDDALARMRTTMARIREHPPVQLGPHAVEALGDLLVGVRRAGGRQTPLALPASDVLILELSGRRRVCIRPSGTEPKLKLYFDLRVEPLASETLLATRARAQTQMRSLIDETLASLAL